MNRRTMLKTTAGAGIATLAAPMMNFGSFRVFADVPTKYSKRAVDLVQRSTVIDMLNPMSLYAVLADLTGAGYSFQPEWFAPHFEFRFPRYGSIEPRGVCLELRQAKPIRKRR